jgi:hypothetical protein
VYCHRGSYCLVDRRVAAVSIIQQDEESATRFGLNDGEDTARRV